MLLLVRITTTSTLQVLAKNNVRRLVQEQLHMPKPQVLAFPDVHLDSTPTLPDRPSPSFVRLLVQITISSTQQIQILSSAFLSVPVLILLQKQIILAFLPARLDFTI